MGTGSIDIRGIRNIILDLGGVILELDVDKTIRAFHALGFPPLQTSDIILSEYPFFLEFETGKISEKKFVRKLMETFNDHVSGKDVMSAWNAMILGFKKENIRLLLELRKHYRLFLLSNTNAMHEAVYNNQLKDEHGIENLDRIFEKVYYSHELKMRKPDPAIFRHVLNDSGLLPGESLYVDDTLVHVETARSLGIRAHHLAFPERITDIL